MREQVASSGLAPGFLVRPGAGAKRVSETMRVMFLGPDEAAASSLTLAVRARWAGVSVLPAPADFASALDAMVAEDLDLVVLTGDMPGSPILTAIEEIRRVSSVALIVVTRSPSQERLVEALDAGADDYIRFPSSMLESMVRAVAVTRRARMGAGRLAGQGSLSHDAVTPRPVSTRPVSAR